MLDYELCQQNLGGTGLWFTNACFSGTGEFFTNTSWECELIFTVFILSTHPKCTVINIATWVRIAALIVQSLWFVEELTTVQNETHCACNIHNNIFRFRMKNTYQTEYRQDQYTWILFPLKKDYLQVHCKINYIYVFSSWSSSLNCFIKFYN